MSISTFSVSGCLGNVYTWLTIGALIRCFTDIIQELFYFVGR